MIKVSAQYRNKALEIAVYDITDTAGHFSGSVAVEYHFGVDTAEADLSMYQFVGPVDAHGYADALSMISYEIGIDRANKPDTKEPLMDAIALIAAELL